MAEPMLYKSTTYPLNTLAHDSGKGTVGLPELQRPFVWPTSKIRDLGTDSSHWSLSDGREFMAEIRKMFPLRTFSSCGQ